MLQFLADDGLVAWVFGMHGYCGVAEHCLQSGGSHLHELVGETFQGVFEYCKHSELYLLLVARHLHHCAFLNVDVFHLYVGDGGLEDGGPVHQSIGAVDESAFEQSHEGLSYCF
jgi:hypothetical protein